MTDSREEAFLTYFHVLGMVNGLFEGSPNTRDQWGPGMVIPACGLSDLSPIDFDVEPFMVDCHWDGVYR